LTLLRDTVALLVNAHASNAFIAIDSTLHRILQSMQSTIEQLQKNDLRFKLKSYTKTIRFVLELSSKLSIAEKSINSKTTKQTRELTILIVDDAKKEALKTVLIKNIMKKMRAKEVRKIIQLENDDLRIQTNFEQSKNVLQKKSETIRRIIESTTIRVQTYAMRVNEVKVEHVDTINQLDVIRYLQKINASLHSDLVIKKIS
jgi:hypothetical protein